VSLAKLAAPLALSCLLAACGSAREAEAKQSAARVARAIEVVRSAPNAAKGAALQDLVKVPCGSPDGCAARDACQAAYALYVEALALTQAAKLQLADGKPADAAKLVGASEEKLTDASRRIADCTEREGALRLRYKL
jgi:hypothetical protein